MNDIDRQKFIVDLENFCKTTLYSGMNEFKEKIISCSDIWLESHTCKVLPDNCKYYTRRGDAICVVLEHKPQVRSLRFTESFLLGNRVGSYKSEEQALALLSLPYVVFTIFFNVNHFTAMYVAYRNKPLETLDDTLYLSNLPNLNSLGKICMGNRWDDNFIDGLSRKPVKSQIDILMSTFWQSCFNEDYSDAFWKYAKDNELGIDNWSKKTLTDPGFIMQSTWTPLMTVKELIGRVCGVVETPIFAYQICNFINKFTFAVNTWIKNRGVSNE